MPRSKIRIVEGFHGTTTNAVTDIMTDGFEMSRNKYDWLGDGIYFWEENKYRAWDWAKSRYGPNAAVIGARIALVDCMDFLDLRWTRLLTECYDQFLKHWKGLGLPLPRQSTGAHRLDREVINYLIAELTRKGMEIRCVRGLFQEGTPVFPDSAIMDKSHIQIVVRDQHACVKSKWVDS